MPVEAQACGCPVVALGAGGARETVVDGVTGVLVPEAAGRGIRRRRSRGAAPHAVRSRRDPRATPSRFSRERFLAAFQAAVADAIAEALPHGGTHRRRPIASARMMRRYNRLLVAFYVLSDALLGMAAFVARLPAPVRRADCRPHPRSPRACRRSGSTPDAAVHRRCWCRRRFTSGALSPAPRPHARRRLLRRVRRQHPRGRPRRRRHPVFPAPTT